MLLCKWEELPDDMRNNAVKPYFDILKSKSGSLVCKRIFDVIVAGIMLVVLFPVFVIIAVAIKIDSKGPVFFRQTRITQYGKSFRIHKFRSMTVNAEREGQITVKDDIRVTRVGKIIRRYRLDEISQLLDILQGTMTFVGVRPEVPKYVAHYTDEMKATLLLPAGVTNRTSIYYADEAKLIETAEDRDKVYIETILPQKMKFNLEEIKKFSFWSDIEEMFLTVYSICKNK